MATAAVRGMYAAIRRSDPDHPDADLLRQFGAVRDEGAFTELVRRHGPLVLGVCRRVIGDRHQADDAFQAVFVVLANKAGRLTADRPLGPWLYGVAFRVALRARAMIGRRRKRETLAAVLPEVAVPPAAEDASAVIDEEIDRLSAVCREALVLCELQGVSRKDAAKRLGIAEGTLSSRLAAAKKALAERLRERGVALGVGVTLPAVSSHLLAVTVAVSTGRAELTPHLLNLIHGATHMGLLGKLKVMAVGVLVVLLSVGGFGLIPSAESNAAPVPKVEPDDGLIWTHNTKTGVLTAYTLDGKTAKELTLKDGGAFIGFTPDGKQILFAGMKGKLADDGDTDELTLHLRDISDKAEGTDTGLAYKRGDQFVFSPDGKQIVRQRLDHVGGGGLQRPKHEHSHVLFDVATKKETAIDLPTDHQIMQWAEDGKTWRVFHSNLGDDPKLPPYRWLTTPVGDKPDLKPICDAGSFNWLEPDAGKESALATGHAHPVVGAVATPCLFRVAGGKAEVLAKFDGAAFVNFRRSPDGKRVVCAKSEYDTNTQEARDTVFVLLSADGKNETKLHTIQGDAQATHLLGWFPAKPTARKKNAPVPKANADPGVVWMYNWQTGKLLAYRPNGDKLKEFTLPYQSRFHGLTPDGKRFVYAAEPGGKVPDKPNLFNGKLTLHTREVGDDTPGTDLGVEERLAAPVVWAPDGKKFYRFDQATTASPKHLLTVFDATGKEEKQIELQGNWPIGWGPDGTSVMLSTMYRMKPPKTTTVSRLTLADGKTEKLFEGDDFDLPQLSPDGKALLGFDNFRPAADDMRPNKAVVRYDLASGKLTDVARREKQGYATGLWSPDGSRVAYRWCEVKPNNQGTTDGDWHIVVSDSDGKNEVKLFTDSESRTAMSTMVVAWTPTPSALKDNSPSSRK